MKWLMFFLFLLPLSIFGQNKVLPFTEGGDKGFVQEGALKVNYDNLINKPNPLVLSGFGSAGGGIYGSYDPTTMSTVYSMSPSYALSADGKSSGNMYGIVRTYEKDYNGVGNNPLGIINLGHQYAFTDNGQNVSNIGYGIWTKGQITGLSNLNLSGIAYLSGNLDINTPINASGLSFRSNGLQRIFAHYMGYENNNDITNSGFQMYSYNNDGSFLGSMFVSYRNGDFQVNNQIRAKNVDILGGNAALRTGVSGSNFIEAANFTHFRNFNNGNFLFSIGVNDVLSYVPLNTNGNKITSGLIDLTNAGNGSGLTNKIRFYNTNSPVEDESSNSFGIGTNHNTGRFSYSAGLTGFHSFYTQNVERLRIDDGSIQVFNSLKIPAATLPNHAVRLDQSQNATNLITGTLTDGRLSTNVALKDQNNIFTSPSNSFKQINSEGVYIKDVAVAQNNRASVVQLNTGEVRLKANDQIIGKVFINSANELDAMAVTVATGNSANDVVNDNQTVSFVSGDVFNLPAATKAVRMVNASGTTNTGVTINLNVPTMKSKEQVLVFSGVGLAFNANVVFNAPSGWFIYSGGSLAASRSFVSQQTTDAGQGCIFRVMFFSQDNTISIMRIKDN